MTTKQHDTAALTDEQVEGVAGGIIPEPSFRPVHIIDPIYLPRPPVGPCGSRGRAGVINPDSM